MLTKQRTTSDAAPGGMTDNEDMTDIAPRAKTNHCERGRQFYELLARVSHWLRYRRQQQVHARVPAYRKRWNIWAGALLGLITTCSTLPSVSMAAYTWTGLPSRIPSGAVAGTVLGQGGYNAQGLPTRQYAYTLGPFSDIGWVNIECDSPGQGPSATPTTCIRVVNGVGYVSFFKGCPSIGFRPQTAQYDDGSQPTTVLSIPAPGLTAQPSTPWTQFRGESTGPVTVTGAWVLLDDVDGGSFNCEAYSERSTHYGLSGSNKTSHLHGIQVLTNDTSWSSLMETTSYWSPAAPPPVVAPSCSFNTTVPLAGTFGSQPLSPAVINATADGKVIALGTPSSFPINITCTGNMTGVQPKLHISWTNVVRITGASWGMGVRNETPSDETNGVVLMSAQGSVGGTASCSGLPAGGEYCVDYDITPGTPGTPGTPLNLYPALFRNTSTSDKVQSGMHTVTGTINLVMP